MNDDALPDTPSEPDTAATTDAIAFGEVSHVIVRRCSACIKQGVISTRTIGEPCGTCGNPEPPETVELGVVSATYRNPVKRIWWNLVRRPLANRRIRRAGARTLELRIPRSDRP